MLTIKRTLYKVYFSTYWRFFSRVLLFTEKIYFKAEKCNSKYTLVDLRQNISGNITNELTHCCELFLLFLVAFDFKSQVPCLRARNEILFKEQYGKASKSMASTFCSTQHQSLFYKLSLAFPLTTNSGQQNFRNASGPTGLS